MAYEFKSSQTFYTQSIVVVFLVHVGDLDDIAVFDIAVHVHAVQLVAVTQNFQFQRYAITNGNCQCYYHSHQGNKVADQTRA